MTKFELSAYVAELSKELDSKKTRINSINDAMEIIKQTTAYINYNGMLRACDWICNLKKETNQQKALKLSNSKSNLNFNTFEQLVKWIKYNKRKCQKKLDKIIPKIAYDKLNVGGNLYPSGNIPIVEFKD